MFFSKVKQNEVIMFYRQFAVMLKAGISISDCLYKLYIQNFSDAFRKIIKQIYFDVISGSSLSEAFSKHPNVFPKYFSNMVSIGESSGTLDDIMTNMANYYENDRKIKKKVSSSMIYPTLLMCMIFIVIIFLCVFVLPYFESIIIKYGGEIPMITVIVLGFSKFIQDNIIYILILVSILSVFLIYIFNTSIGKYAKDVIKINAPIISKIERNLITARFAKAFVILLGSGMNMVDILENLRKMLGNEVFERKFVNVIEQIKSGKRIAVSIEETNLFPHMLTEMINVGENSGNLEEVLTSTGEYFEMQVETSIAKAVAIIEPVAIILLGFIVLFVLLSVFLPIMSIMNAI